MGSSHLPLSAGEKRTRLSNEHMQNSGMGAISIPSAPSYGEYEYVTNIHREYTATLKCGYRRYIHELTLIEVTNDELTTILQHQDIGIWYQQNRHPIKKRPWWTIFMR
jgi:hypothetical protein